MKNLLFLLLISFTTLLSAQDTLYALRYPNGIEVKEFKETTGHIVFSPIDNISLRISLKKREVGKTLTSKGIVNMKGDTISKTNKVILNVQPNTGKIYYSDVIIAKDKSKKELFDATLRLPNSSVIYEIVSSDNVNFSYRNYKGKFKAKFAGDDFNIYFNLFLNFKDGKIKYSYSDFYIYDYNSKSSNWSLFGNVSTTKLIDKSHSLDLRYSNGDWGSDQRLFWIPIKNAIEESIRILIETAKQTDDW